MNLNYHGQLFNRSILFSVPEARPLLSLLLFITKIANVPIFRLSALNAKSQAYVGGSNLIFRRMIRYYVLERF